MTVKIERKGDCKTMGKMSLEETIGQISALDEPAMEVARKRWDSIAKPLNSLGMMEEMIVQIAGMTGETSVDVQKKALVEMCADNGVVEEGVTQTGQEITALVAENFLKGETVACTMCRQAHADVVPIDVGMAVDTKVPRYKSAYGTQNFVKGPAMTREQAVEAIEAGIQVAGELAQKGYRLLAMGEMGIGNTTTSSAVASVLLQAPVEDMTGRGAGLSSEGLKRKIQAIKKGIEVNQPDPHDPIDVLRKVGGFDIAALAGLCLGGALNRIPVLMDGFISGVAALIAVRLCPAVSGYLLASHVSKEPAAVQVLEAMGKEAMIHGKMCMGEGTGAAALFPLLDMAATIYNTMSTFEDIHMDQYEHLE